MNWFRRFMAGRYGMDMLSFALLIVALLVDIIGNLTRFYLLRILVLLLVVLVFFRALSRNIDRRHKENAKFVDMLRGFREWRQGRAEREALKVQERMAADAERAERERKRRAEKEDRRTHRYYTCPTCGKKLRVPRGKGKIQITCPVCKASFIKKT